jgi:ABC-type dipeptide/oligopeptide/nickel transport system ATPase component
MKEKNPFCISFGRPPINSINRTTEKQKIIDMFSMEPVTDQIFLITGVRGSGKTVLLGEISNELEQSDEWIVLREDTAYDINQSIYSDLYNTLYKHKISLQNISVTFPVGSLTIENMSHNQSLSGEIDKLLEIVEKHKKKVLVTIDEVYNCENIKKFSKIFQTALTKKRPIFFLGTGLYENIYSLINEKDLTFLHRAPRIELAPLNGTAMAASYQSVFHIPLTKAMEMAAMTKGYSFAFQALGYVLWENDCPDDISTILSDYDALLSDASYSIIWRECSKKDQEVLKAMAGINSTDVSDIRKACSDMSSNYFSVYRNRLINKGILISPGRSTLTFALPRFREFIQQKVALHDFITF